MTTDARGLYVHIPFCRSKCNYCDFCSYPGRFDTEIDAYIDRLLSEAEQYGRGGRLPIDTVYLGGGTPSLLSPRQLDRIFSALYRLFSIAPDAEITMEANPGTLTSDAAREYFSLGVNRVSLGLQSASERELRALGRIHTFPDFLNSFELLRGVGFANISIDLMYGIPHQTPDSFRETLSRVVALAPEHISAYGLIVEEGTPFYDCRDTLPLPTEDEECEMYGIAAEYLRDGGYRHYEISNYAKPGFESRHNLKYWRDEEYIGIGAAAYSYFLGKRYGNPRSLDLYMASAPVEGLDIPKGEDEEFEYAMMHLRLSEGIDLASFERRFGKSFTKGKEDKLRRYLSMGLLTYDEKRVALTERGFYLSNAIMADIL